MRLFLAIGLSFVSISVYPIYNEYNNGHMNPTFDLTTPDMIRQEGYMVEEHTVSTDDGYFLTMHRIPGKPGSQPVFVQHGLLSNSFDWVISGRNKALAFILSDSGYDVWMGNARGNTYSQHHQKYISTDPKFWDFSWHEMGIYDLPAEIAYVTKATNQSIFYVGHSMGTTMFYVMAIERPDIASKVKAMFSFAPVAFMQHMKSPIRYLSMTINQMESLNEIFGFTALLPQSPLLKRMNHYGCEVFLSPNTFCSQIIFTIAGFNAPQFNYTLLPTILSHTPAGTSMKSLYHYLQLINTKRFNRYNYGHQQNLKVYNTSEPPDYDLSKIQVPIGIFWSENDLLADPLDVNRFYNSIPNKMFNHKVDCPGFSHVDYMWAIDAPKLLYSKLLTELKSY